MHTHPLSRVPAAALLALSLLVHSAGVLAYVPQARGGPAHGPLAGTDADFARLLRATSRSAPAAAPAGKAPAAPARAQPAVTRAGAPLIAVTSAGPGQDGYVHYFLLRLPDDTLEIQVGIELPDQRIAWSFPELGAVISPFMQEGTMTAGGREYEVWHLYGIRPFPGEAAMTALRRDLVQRVQPWVRARTPYCEHDAQGRNCMSCLGFVLRVLFPGRGGYPELPRDFWRAGFASSHTTRDLLLYLTGMLDLPTREARLQRIARQAMPDELRAELEDLVYAMGAQEAAPPAHAVAAPVAAPRRTEPPPPKVGNRPVQRRRL